MLPPPKLPSSPPSTHAARALISVGVEDQLAKLREPCLRKRLTELVIFVSMLWFGITLTVSSQLYWESSWFRWLSLGVGVVTSAIALNAWVLLLHEAMHGTLFVHPSLNRWSGVLLGVPLLISFTAYQVMHLRHHEYLGDARDPDDYANYVQNRSALILMHLVRLSCGAFLYLLLIPLLAYRYGTRGVLLALVQEYGVMALIWTAVLTFTPRWIVGLAWGVPVIIVAYLTNIRGFVQHGITNVQNPFLASRSMRPHPWVAFCLLNENFHLEHHLFPEVPCYSLGRLHTLLEPRLPCCMEGRSYLMFLVRFAWATIKGDPWPIGLVTQVDRTTLNADEITA